MKCIGTYSPSVSTKMQQKINSVEGQVETIQNSPDVADIVASYDALTKYDKSSLTNKAVIKVLKDEKHANKEAYYRYLTADNDFTFIDVNDSNYTKSETDALLKTHTDKKDNPHSVTKAQVGLGNVNNTSDADKPISTATQDALDLKADKTEIPTKTSQLTNDSGFLTSHQDISGKADKASTLSGYGITDAYTKTESDGKYLTEHQDISGKADKANTLAGYGITDAYTKTESDNKYLTEHQDISTLATKDEVTSGLATKQNTITGAAGEVVYHNGTSVFTQSVMNTGYAVATTEDLNACKNSAPSFSDVFNKWKKFSHRNATNDAIPSEMTAWTYDSGTDTITQPLNTESYVGFISPKSYSSYDVTVRCYSTGADDDSIGLVAAFAKDSNGLEHTLSFIRSPGGTSAKWVAILDYNQFALTGTSYGQKILVNNSAASTTPSSTANWNTESIGTGTVINMVRNGNVITAKCSQFNSSTLDDSTLITIDLDALSEANPTLNLFKGASPWGYSNFSQPNSKYENISVTDPDGMIFDITNNEVLQYNPATKTWGVVSGMNPVEEVGAGRFSYNSITGKLFFCTGTEIFQVATNTNI